MKNKFNCLILNKIKAGLKSLLDQVRPILTRMGKQYLRGEL